MTRDDDDRCNSNQNSPLKAQKSVNPKLDQEYALTQDSVITDVSDCEMTPTPQVQDPQAQDSQSQPKENHPAVTLTSDLKIYILKRMLEYFIDRISSIQIQTDFRKMAKTSLSKYKHQVAQQQ
jgi:uncharacterized lipoprotein